MKTELPKEWQKLAEIKAGCTIDTMDFGNQWAYNIAVNAAEYDFIQGAKAYRDEVEALLRKHIELCEDQARSTPQNYTAFHDIITSKKKAYEMLLTELKTLTPTTNE